MAENGMTDWGSRYLPSRREVAEPYRQEGSRLPTPSETDTSRTEWGKKYLGAVTPNAPEFLPPRTKFWYDYGPPVDQNLADAKAIQLAETEDLADNMNVLEKALAENESVIRPITDLLSIFNYSIAGGVEELGTGDPGISWEDIKRAGKRFGVEFANALPGVEVSGAQRHGFGQALETMGVGEGGRLSNLLPFLYSETGKEWYQWQEGGLFDFTPRGAAGLALDIVTDPISWATLGSKDAIKITLKSGSRSLGKRALTKAGEQSLLEHTAKAIGLSEEGVRAFQLGATRGIGAIDGTVDLRQASNHVRKAFEDAAGYKLQTSVNLKTQHEATKRGLRAAVKAASEEAEQKLASIYLTDPKMAADLFDDGGLKFMGKMVPGTNKLMREVGHLSVDTRQWLRNQADNLSAKSDLANWVIETTRDANAFASSALRWFKRDKTADPIALIAKQRLIDETALLRGNMGSELHRIMGTIDLSSQEWDRILKAIDDEYRIFGRDAAKNGHVVFDRRATDVDHTLFGTRPVTDTITNQTTMRNTFVDAIKRKLPDMDQDLVERVATYAVETLHKMDVDEFAGWREDILRIARAGNIKGAAGILAKAEDGLPRYLAAEFQGMSDEAINNALANPIGYIKDYLQQTLKVGPDHALREPLEKFLYQYIARSYVTNLPIYFTNRSGKITSGVIAMSKKFGFDFTEDKLLGKWRAFYSPISRTLLDEKIHQLRSVDPMFVNFRPVHDLREVMRRRIDLHAEDQFFRKWRNFIQDNYDPDLASGAINGKSGLALSIFRDLADPPEGLTQASKTKVETLHGKFERILRLANDKAKREVKNTRFERNGEAVVTGPWEMPARLKRQFDALTPDEKKYFLQKELQNASSRRDLETVLLRYAEEIRANPEILPKYRDSAAMARADITNHRKLDMPGTVGTLTIDVPIDIFDDFTSYRKSILNSRDIVPLLKLHDALTGFFKTWVTAAAIPVPFTGISIPLFPAFHVRNAYGNVALGFTDAGWSALNPIDHKLSSAIIARSIVEGKGRLRLTEMTPRRRAILDRLDKAMEETIVTTKRGTEYTLKEIYDEGRRLGVWTDDIKLFELADDYSPYVGGKLRSKMAELGQRSRAPGEVIENEARMQLFIRHIRRGLSPEDAAARVKQFLFDYSNLSQLEKEFFRRVVPFYTFFSRNLKTQVRELVRDPGKLSTQVKLLRERGDENDRMAGWDVEGTYARLDRDGRHLTILDGVDLPMFQLKYLDTLFGNPNRRRETAAMINPLVRYPIEETFGIDTFTGKPIDRKTRNSIGAILESTGLTQNEKFRDWMGYNKTVNPYSGRVEYVFEEGKMRILLDAWFLSRLVRTSDKVFSQLVESSDPDFLQMWLTGTTVKNLDLEKEDYMKMIRRQRQIQKHLELRGVKSATDLDRSEY